MFIHYHETTSESMCPIHNSAQYKIESASWDVFIYSCILVHFKQEHNWIKYFNFQIKMIYTPLMTVEIC